MNKYYIKIIGILIFVYIFLRVDISEVYEVVAKARMDYLLIVLLLAMPILLLKSWRWKYLLKMQGMDYDLKCAFLIYLSSGYLGVITPGRVGEFAKVFYLKEDKGINLGKAFSSVLFDRVLDLSVLLIFSFAGILHFFSAKSYFYTFPIFLMFIIVMAIIFLNARIRNKGLHIIKKWIPSIKLQDKMDLHYSSFFEAMNDFKSMKILIPIAASFFAYFIFYFSCYLMAASLGIQISFLNIIYCVSVANLISLIPISISGIGTRDATLIFLFSLLGLNKEAAVGFSIIFLSILYIFNATFGFMAWLKKPLNNKHLSFAGLSSISDQET
jgi:glycosyltransferase 2 family protein